MNTVSDPFFHVDIPDLDFGSLVPEDEADPLCRVDSAADALIASKNDLGDIDVDYMKRIYPGLTLRSLYQLRDEGAIFQDPAFFSGKTRYDPWKGWTLREKYLTGFLVPKLKSAVKAEEKFRGVFERNVSALRALLPAALSLDEIHVTLGAPWVPEKIYEDFIRDLLRLRSGITVRFSKENAQWVFDLSKEAKRELEVSVLNYYKYGSKAKRPGFHDLEEGLTAEKIILHTMNSVPVAVHDKVYNALKNKDEYVINRAATLAAQEKQKLIVSRFEEWIRSDPALRSRLEEAYSDAFVGYSASPYDGSFLKFADMNPEVSLYPHQKNAIARILLSDSNVLLAHDVGAGKTYVMVAGIHELKRTRLAGRILAVVPNNVLKATVDAHAYLYPDDRVLAVYPKDFSPKSRDEILQKIRTGDYTAVYMASSSFDLITMSKEYWIGKKTAEIDKLKAALIVSSSAAEKSILESRIRDRSERLKKYIVEEEQTPWLPFDRLGIDVLVVDEAHAYKGIPIESKSHTVVGMHHAGSKKSVEMLEKCGFCKRLIFATGTPLTNSLTDLYVLQRYLQPEELRAHGIDNFDMWVKTFAEEEVNYEIDIESSNIRPVVRCCSFHNLTELMALFSNVCDHHHTDESSEGLPAFHGYTDITVPRSRAQAEFIRELAKRTEQIRMHKVQRKDDNLLLVTLDGRNAALDPRLAGIPEHDPAKGKIAACAGQILPLYHRYPGTCQIVFCDLGTPGGKTFDVYSALKAVLVSGGIAASEIAFIHDADSETKRAGIFRMINAGLIRVIIGSTPKLGIGVNVQERLIALHHLSVPWRPADMVQREGRLIRRGNTCEEVFIFRYVTEGTFDSYSWQLLENKQRFISSFLSGFAAERNADDIADAILSYAEIKALAIGNPLIKKRVETGNLLERARMASRQRQKQLVELRSVAEKAPGTLREIAELIAVSKKDWKLYEKCRVPIPNEERIALGEELLAALKENVLKNEERFFDTYQGFSVFLPDNMAADHPYVTVRSQNGGCYYVDMDGGSPLGCSKRLDWFLEHFSDRIRSLKADQKQTENRHSDALAELEKGNPFPAAISAYSDLLAEIDKQLAECEVHAS